MKLRDYKTTLLSLALVAAFCGGAVLDANAATRARLSRVVLELRSFMSKPHGAMREMTRHPADVRGRQS